MPIDLSIVTVGYRSEDTIVPFLDSIKKSRDGLNKEIVIVDNYPADKGADLAESHSLHPKVIRNSENLGFSKGINRAIKETSGKYILIINPDTRIVGNALRQLYDFAESHPQMGAVVPRLLNYDGKIQPSCFKFPTISNAIKYNFFGCRNCYKKYDPGNKTTAVEVAVMAAFLLPRTVINIVGKLDERFFLYYEDVEYCRRLYKNHYPVYYYPKAKVQHAHGVSGNFTAHLNSPLLSAAKTYYGPIYFFFLNIVLWLGHKWQVIIRGKRFRD